MSITTHALLYCRLQFLYSHTVAAIKNIQMCMNTDVLKNYFSDFHIFLEYHQTKGK